MAKQHSHKCPKCQHEWFHENPSLFVSSEVWGLLHTCAGCGFGPVTDKHQCDCGQVHQINEYGQRRVCPGTPGMNTPIMFSYGAGELDRLLDDLMEKFQEN